MQSEQDLSVRRHALLGITVDAITKEEILGHAKHVIQNKHRNAIFGNHNLHSVHLFHKMPEVREFYRRCYLTHIDGMSLIAIGRMLGVAIERRHRTTYLDWIEEFLQLAQTSGWRIYVLGGTESFANDLPCLLWRRFPLLKVRCHQGFAGRFYDQEILAEIAEFAPHVLMVGMGMPRQEQWILRSLAQLDTNAIFTCGAAFEYLAGVKYRPPRWAGQMGLEWLFRLVSEPSRLAARYLLEPAQIIPLVLREVVTRRPLMGAKAPCGSGTVTPWLADPSRSQDR